MNRRFLILMSSLLTGTIISAQAGPYKDIEGLEEFLSIIPGFKSIPSPRTFKADASRTAAGILHYAIDREQGPVILLGVRKDGGTLCNLGGMSDAEEGQTIKFKTQDKKENSSATLAQTGSREVGEESNDYYTHHPYDLERQPFTDVLMNRKGKKSLLYRMYWKKVQKVGGDILYKAMENGQTAHNKEYTGFMWVPVEQVLTSVKQKRPTIKLGEEQEIEFFEPLFKTLSTDSGVAFLESILTTGKISLFNKKLRPLQNRLYFIGDEIDKSASDKKEKVKSDDLPSKKSELEHADFKVHWELPNSSPTPEKTKDVILNPGQEKEKKITFHKGPLIPLGQNAWGEKKQILKLDGLSQPFEVPLSAEKDKKDTAYAVAALGDAMVELKSKAKDIRRKAKEREEKRKEKEKQKETAQGKEEKEKEKEKEKENEGKKAELAVESFEPNSTEGENSNSNLTFDRIHLRIVLGEQFKTVENFPEVTNPQRAADIANLRTYLTTHSDVECEQKDVKAEFKRQINFTGNDLEILADYLEWVEQQAFAHGATADLNNLWKSFTYLRKLLSLSPLLEKIVMRGTDIYFRDFKTMEDILKSRGFRDYEDGKGNLLLCANYVLAAGRKTTCTSSSSIEYFLNNHSVAAPDIEEKFEEATALAGINGRYAYFHSPFLQFLAHRHPNFENSVLVGISVPPDLLADHTYAAHPGGRPFTKKGGETLTVTDIFKGIQDEYEAHKETPEPFEERREEKRNLIPEARLSLHPDFVFNEGVKMKAFDRFPLEDSEQEQFEHEMRTATIGTLADWLASHFKVMPDSLAEYPRLKRLYNYAYKAMTGEDVKEKFAFESFSYLVTNRHLNGIKEFVKAFPEIVDHEELYPLFQAYITLTGNKAAIIKYFCEELIKQTPQDIYGTSEKFQELILTCLMKGALGTLDYLFSIYDLKKVPETLIQECFNRLERTSSDELSYILANYFPESRSKSLAPIFRKEITEAKLNRFVMWGMSPQILLEELMAAKQGEILSLYSNELYELVSFISKNLPESRSRILEPILEKHIDEKLLIRLSTCYGMSPQILLEELMAARQGKESPGDEKVLVRFISKNLPEFRYKILEPILKCSVTEKQLDTFISCGMSPQVLLEELMVARKGEEPRMDANVILETLVTHKVDLKGPHSQTGKPLSLELINSRLLQAFFRKATDQTFKTSLDTLISCGMSPQIVLEELIVQDFKDSDLICEILVKYKIDLESPHTRTSLPLRDELVQSKFLQSAFKSSGLKKLDGLVLCGVKPQVLLEEGIASLKKLSFHYNNLLKIIVKYKIDLSVLCSKTKLPLIFEIIDFKTSLIPEEFINYFYEQLPSLMECTDGQGLTIFDHAQRAWKLGRNNKFLDLVNPYHLVNGQDTIQPKDEHQLSEKEQKDILDTAKKALKEVDFRTFYRLRTSHPQVVKEGIKYGKILKFYTSFDQPFYSPFSETSEEKDSVDAKKALKEEKYEF